MSFLPAIRISDNADLHPKGVQPPEPDQQRAFPGSSDPSRDTFLSRTVLKCNLVCKIVTLYFFLQRLQNNILMLAPPLSL